MTRFARAKGSKASNERKEEEPTPWHVMRQKLVEHSSSKQTESIEHVPYKLKDILNNQNACTEEVWSDFGIPRGTIKTNTMEPNTRVKRKKNNSKEVQFKEEKHCVEKKRKNKTNASCIEKRSKTNDTLQSEYTPGKHEKEHELNENKVDESTKEKKVQIKSKTKQSKNCISLQKKNYKKMSSDSSLKKHTGEHRVPVCTQWVTNEQTAKNPNVNVKKNKEFIYDGNKPKKVSQNEQSTNHRAHHNSYSISANGREIKVVHFEGFLIKEEDAVLLKKIRKQLRTQNIPKENIKSIIKLERRKAEKALAREKNKVCFYCRKFGHNFIDCPEIKESESAKSGICFKCGSTEHSHTQCKVLQNQNFRYAVCFVCKEQGHIARQCSLNPQGQYPKGGSCHLCGEVSHLRKDCPKSAEEKPNNSVTVGLLNNDLLEDINVGKFHKNEPGTGKSKLVQF